MSYGTAAVTGGAPERVAAIQEQIQALRSTTTGPVSPVDFEALLRAEEARQAETALSSGAAQATTPGAVVPAGDTLSVTAGRTVGSPPAGPVAPAPTDPVAPAPTDPVAPAPTDPVAPVGWPGAGAAELRYQPLFEQAGLAWNIDPALLAAVAATESAFDPGAVSPAGAQGLMQFMPATAASMGVDPWDPSSAIDGAARYLRRSLDRFGSSELAIASYNAGPGAVARYNGIPPYRETQNYVRKVLAAWQERT